MESKQEFLENRTTIFEVFDKQVSIKIELSLSCESLISNSLLSEANSLIEVFIKDGVDDKEWKKIGNTECCKDTNNPIFVNTIPIEYYFQNKQMLRFIVFDVEGECDKSNKIGKCEVSVGDIITCHERKVTILNKKKEKGKIKIRYNEVSDDNMFIEFKFIGSDINLGLFEKSELYLILKSPQKEGEKIWKPIQEGETERVKINKTNSSYEWNAIIPKKALCKNNPKHLFSVECFDWNSFGSPKLVGVVKTSLEELSSSEVKIKLKNGRISIKCKEFKLNSFIDYIKGGTEISLIIGIDYTASNGDPSEKDSFHYQDPEDPTKKPNKYLQAISALMEVLAPYDSDKKYGAFGFGAKLVSKENETSHCFPINQNPENPYCDGVDGLMQAYINSFDDVTLAGPTILNEVIECVLKISKNEKKKGSKYFILLIITDGKIERLKETKEFIQQSFCEEPISTIIVGLGPSDFKIPDENEKKKESFANAKTKKSKFSFRTSINKSVSNRNKTLDPFYKSLLGEIRSSAIKFVKFDDFVNKSLLHLAQETLAQVPHHFLAYMKLNEIEPGTKN